MKYSFLIIVLRLELVEAEIKISDLFSIVWILAFYFKTGFYKKKKLKINCEIYTRSTLIFLQFM